MAKPDITPELLRQLLRYEPETGKLFWLPRPLEMFKCERGWKIWNTRFSNSEAFTAAAAGRHKHGAIFKKLYYAHRIAWVIAFGDMPDGMCVDHINGDGFDNRLCNLRLATHSQNLMNVRGFSHNTSGHKGVCWDKSKQRWQVTVGNKFIGRFRNLEEAAAAYLAAAEQYFGEFAYHNRKQEV
jgi:hypothetical protein